MISVDILKVDQLEVENASLKASSCVHEFIDEGDIGCPLITCKNCGLAFEEHCAAPQHAAIPIDYFLAQNVCIEYGLDYNKFSAALRVMLSAASEASKQDVKYEARLRWVSEKIDTVANRWGSFESWEEYCAVIDDEMTKESK